MKEIVIGVLWRIAFVLVLSAPVLSARQVEIIRYPPAPPQENTLSMMLGRFGYFWASDPAFAPIYGNGSVFGGELRLGGRIVTGWLEGSYRTRTGKFSFTGEETKVAVTALEGGVIFRILPGPFMPYAGAGVGYYSYAETNEPIGRAKKYQWGACAVAGATLKIADRIALDYRIKYSTCRMRPADTKIEIGGLTLGLGLGLFF